MDFKKFLEMTAEAELLEAKKKKESTSEKDHKAEKAGKKVAKDIEYDEDHKGKDDKKAEKAGKKVTKDIEYDDKKDKKKKSLKDWFEALDKKMISEAGEIAVPILDKTGKAMTPKPGFIKIQGDQSPAGKAMAAALADMAAKKQIQVAAPVDPMAQQNKPVTGTVKQPTQAPTQAPATGTAMKEEEVMEKAPPGMEDVVLSLKKKFPGEEGRAYAIAWSMYNKKHGKTDEGVTPDKAIPPKTPMEIPKKERERVPLKVPFEAAEDNPDSAMLDEKWAGDAKVKPTGEYKGKSKEELKAMLAKLQKSGPHGKDSPEAKKQRQINFALRAKGGWKKGEGAAMKEAEIPSQGPDYGAGLGAGRNDEVLETQQVNESMNLKKLKAAYQEGYAHGLRELAARVKHYEDMEEAKQYFEGYKSGLEECYGLAPNRGLVVSEVDQVPATVPGMANQAEKEMDEGNAFTAALAKTPQGGKFTVGGKTFTDKSGYDAKIDEFAFESLDKQLNALLESEQPVSEGLSVSMSTGNENSPDSVSVTGTDDEAGKLLAFIKQVGLGGMGDDKPMVGGEEPVVAVASDYGAPKFSGHDGMAALMKKVGVDDEDEKGHDHTKEAKPCNECGMSEGCGCEKKEAVMGEEETPDQMTDEMAEGYDDDGYEGDEADAAKIDASMPAKGGATHEDASSEAGSGPAAGVEAGDEAEEAEAEMKESAKLDEWANEAGKKGTDAAFERDIEFMTKVIAGGLNKPKATGQTTIPVIASQDARNGDEDVKAWKKLAGLEK